ncbi:MAG: DUF4834 family protein [Cyclobacteriaceae bacterium]
MLKFIIISILFIYVVFKASDFILRMIDSVTGGGRMKAKQRERNFGPEHRRQQQQQRKYRQPQNGNVNIDYIPEDEKKKQRHPTEDFKGGEYVDYEDLK